MNEITTVPLARIAALHEGTIGAQLEGVAFVSDSHQWAYSAEAEFSIPGIESDSRMLKIGLELESGILGVGWLHDNQTDWVAYASATRGAKEVRLMIPAHTRVGKLVFINWTEGGKPARGIIRSITISTVPTIAMSHRYVVSNRVAGLGDCLISLCAAWRFARLTRRTLVADWRHSVYTPVSNMNLFPFCFQPQSEIAGVPFVCDDSIQQIRLPLPRYPEKWNDERVLQDYFFSRPQCSLTDRDAAVELIRSGTDVEAPTVVFDTCLSDAVVSWREARTFLEALHPLDHLVDQVKTFRDTHLRPGPSIGLHVRHGNGGYIGAFGPFWELFDKALDRCRIAVSTARTQLGGNATVLLCTDSLEVQQILTRLLAPVVCWPKPLRAANCGELHERWQAEQGRDDLLIEMLLLTECEALVRYPPSSFFSFYAAMMKSSRLSPPETTSRLGCGCDASDALSAALLL